MNGDLRWCIESFDLASWAHAHGAERAGYGAEMLLPCPRCGKNKLSINVEKKRWHCFVCEAAGVGGGRAGRGGLLDLIELIDGLDRHQACDLVTSQASNVKIPNMIPTLAMDQKPRAMTWALPVDFPSMSVPIDEEIYARYPFLKRRGIGFVDCRLYGLRMATVGRYAHRVLFPVFENGNMVYWQARATWEPWQETVGSRYIKVLNPHKDSVGGVTTADVLFGFDLARNYERIALVEGPIDAIRTGPDAMATFGKRLTAWQVAKLRATQVRQIDFMWDGPGPTEPQGAWPEMIAAAPYLESFFEVRLVRLPSGDPGSRTPQEIASERAQAIPWADVRGSLGKCTSARR